MKSSVAAFSFLAILGTCNACFADLSPSSFPQAAPPQVSDDIKRVIANQTQANPNLAAAQSTTPAPVVSLPQNLPAAINNARSNGASSDNFTSQHSYHNQVIQYLQTHPLK